MSRLSHLVFALGLGSLLAGPCLAQDSAAAATTRKKLQKKVTVDYKEVGTKALFDELNLEFDKPFKFVIDNKSGVSNNSKMSYKGKDVTVEKVLNDLADKFDFGWAVISNASNNKVDGSIVIRKTKERGYEAGKEPKKGAAEKQVLLSQPLGREAGNRHPVAELGRVRVGAKPGLWREDGLLPDALPRRSCWPNFFLAGGLPGGQHPA